MVIQDNILFEGFSQQINTDNNSKKHFSSRRKGKNLDCEEGNTQASINHQQNLREYF